MLFRNKILTSAYINPVMKRYLMILASALLVLGCQKEVYHNITVSINPAEGGSVSPSSGPVLDGTSVFFKATPKGDYVFTGWSGSISGTDNPKTVTVTQDMNVTANFTLRSYPLTITIEGDGTVSEKFISTKSEYQSGAVVELTATPSDHWLFDHWEGDVSGTANPAQIIVSSAKNVKAVFVEKTYPLNIEIEGEGAVSEKIIQTKATYQEGNVVELTANPSTGWSFDHWGGDLSGNDNPAQIAVSSEKTVKAVFVKSNFSFNVKIIGPGVVDEYLVENTKATVEYGKQVRLVAIPSDGAIFKGWKGSVSGNEKEILVDIDHNIEIEAEFYREVKEYPSPDLSLPSSYRKQLYYGVDFTTLCTVPSHFLPLDYNGDGLLDVVTCAGYDENVPVRFFAGIQEGGFELDKQNSDKYFGPTYGPRKWLPGDINGDGVIDVCIVGHGLDEYPWPGASPVLLLSSPNGEYQYHKISETVGYYHGSALGDFDNDGDDDILLLEHSDKSVMLINDGSGEMVIKKGILNSDIISGSMYSCEFFDLNHDGFLDLIIGGHEHEGKEWHSYANTTCVFWGNGIDYNHYNYLRFPRFKDGYGVTLDYCFYDLDNDGQEEIINVRTGDGLAVPSYCGWAVQIVDFDGKEFHDVTSSYINDVDNSETQGPAVVLINIEEIDDELYLCGRIVSNAEKLFKISDGKFIRCRKDESNIIKNGTCLYSDGSGVKENHIDMGCKTEKFLGETSMHFYSWPTWNGWAIDYTDFMDFSKLEKNGYCLEFAIKNFDPDLWIEFAFETRLQTEPWYFPTYHYSYDAHEHKTDGTWELVQVPLSSLKCDEEWTGYYWNTIKTINIMPGDCHSKDFYLDEIRIRKIQP